MYDADSVAVSVRMARSADYGEIFTLQRAAYVDEGILYGSFDVPALTESLTEFTERLLVSESWVAVSEGRIVGAVSLRAHSGVPSIERLMVAPDWRGRSISSRLLSEAEIAALKAGASVI